MSAASRPPAPRKPARAGVALERLLDGLNPEQREAVTTSEGPLLVLAGAGSGKTRVVAVRIAYLLAKRLAKPEEILAVTFTNKAAGEMRERIGALVGGQAAQGLWVSTFHAFCLRVLRAHAAKVGLRPNFTIFSESDQRSLWRRIVADGGFHKEQLDLETLVALVSRVKNDGRDSRDVAGERDDKYGAALPDLYLRYQTALRAQNGVDFDDLLSLAVHLFQKHPDVQEQYRQRFKYLLVDEYQDTNPIQAKIVRLLAEPRGNLCVVGDDDQSIYAFRGAAVANILNFRKLGKQAARQILLSCNYRSTQTILDAAGAVIDHNPHRHPKRLTAHRGPGRPLDLFAVNDEEDEARRVAERMQQIRDSVQARWSDFAVLYRSNLQSRPFELYCRAHRIPYRVVGGQNFFERGEVKDLLAYLKVLVNERDETSLLRVINTPPRGIGDHSLEKLVGESGAQHRPLVEMLRSPETHAGLSGSAREGLSQFWALMSKARQALEQQQPSTVLERLMLETDYSQYLSALHKSDGALAMRMDNVQGLLDAMKRYEAENVDGSLLEFLQESSLLGGDEHGKRDEHAAENAVTLMSIHGAKGLEFPFVFIAGCEEGFLPHEKSLWEPGGAEEERRLFYVALTRAQRHCCLLHAATRLLRGRARPRTPSRFLAEIPDTLFNRVSLVREAPAMPPGRARRRP